jgi:hypothetical protein
MNFKINYIIFLCVILFSIGITLWYLGCNTNVKNGCLSKKMEYAIVEDSYIIKGIIKNGIIFVVNINFIYGDLMCEHMHQHYGDLDSANKEIEKYSKNKKSKILVNRNDSKKCTHHIQKYHNYWNIGLLLLSFSGLIIIGIMIRLSIKKQFNYDIIQN